MEVFTDEWKTDPNEASWFARKRYNEKSPFTILQYSSAGWPLAIGGEVAAQSEDLLRDAGITCRLCVAGHRTKWEAGERPPPIAGVQDLEDFSWNLWCNRSGFAQINKFVSSVAV